jgi:hypothetical protein
MVYFLGTGREAPILDTWTESSPRFYVSEPQPEELSGVRTNLPLPFVRYLGAYTGCGCGFRSIPRDGFRSDPEHPAATQADHESLVRYLREVLTENQSAQIYGCWSGEESQPAERHRTIEVSEIASSDFVFRERELLTVIPDSPSDSR